MSDDVVNLWGALPGLERTPATVLSEQAACLREATRGALTARVSETFKISRHEVRRSLGPNWFVKLIFTRWDGSEGERMWVRVLKAELQCPSALRETTRYTGLLPHENLVRQAPDLRARLARVKRMLAPGSWGYGCVLVRARQEHPGVPLARLLADARRANSLRAFSRELRKDLARREETRRERVASALAPVVLAAWAQCGYRSPSERWCDRAGETVTIRVGDRARVSSDSSRVWHSKKSFRGGTASEHILVVPESWNRDVANRTLAVVDGMLTLSASPLGARAERRLGAHVYVATWVEQSTGLTVRAREGYLAAAQTGDGLVAVHGATSLGALRTLEARIRPDELAARRRAKTERAKARQAAQAPFRALRAALRAEPAAAPLLALLPVCAAIAAGALEAEITLADSTPQTSGNCVSGTRDWVARHLPGRTRATVGQVVQAALVSGDRVDLALRACQFAVLRWSRGFRTRKAAA